MRLYNKIDHTIEREINSCSITSLWSSFTKKDSFSQLEEQIEKLITDMEEIEEMVSESLELQAVITDN